MRPPRFEPALPGIIFVNQGGPSTKEDPRLGTNNYYNSPPQRSYVRHRVDYQCMSYHYSYKMCG